MRSTRFDRCRCDPPCDGVNRTNYVNRKCRCPLAVIANRTYNRSRYVAHPLPFEQRSQLMKGRVFTAEHRANLAAALNGRKASDAQRAKVSAALRGRPVSDAQRAKVSAALTVHGHARKGHPSGTYRSWQAMLRRCTNQHDSRYKYYGGKGVTVCERWQSFELFLQDMGERPPGTTNGRFGDIGNYEPGNCKWMTPAEQLADRSNHHRLPTTSDPVTAGRTTTDRSNSDA